MGSSPVCSPSKSAGAAAARRRDDHHNMGRRRYWVQLTRAVVVPHRPGSNLSALAVRTTTVSIVPTSPIVPSAYTMKLK